MSAGPCSSAISVFSDCLVLSAVSRRRKWGVYRGASFPTELGPVSVASVVLLRAVPLAVRRTEGRPLSVLSGCLLPVA